MGKTYIDTVKYLVKASFDVDGIIDKPDIVGAIFGQTEGLLGDELDLRELQKNGRLGRIEVETQVRNGKTQGTILIPSSLDMVETSILAASLEVVDRVGPCEAKITVAKIEDTRNIKRRQVLDRAKNLLKTMIVEELPESKELADLVRDDVRVSDVAVYGEDQLPCGPGLQASDAIIVVEGRADVVNMLKNGIKNVVAIGGANVGKTIVQLCKEKEATVFLDGDRGGDIILRELVSATDVDYVARASTGKEVEELTRKEIIMALRKRVPIEQVEGYTGEKRNESKLARLSAGSFGESLSAAGISQANQQPVAPVQRDGRDSRDRFNGGGRERGYGGNGREERQGRFENREREVRPVRVDRGDRVERVDRSERVERAPVRVMPVNSVRAPVEPVMASVASAPVAVVPVPKVEPEVPVDPVKVNGLKAVLKDLEGSLKARVLAEDLSVLAEVPIREVLGAITSAPKVFAVVLDGIVTQRLVDAAEQKNAEYVAGIRAGTITRKAPTTHIVLAA